MLRSQEKNSRNEKFRRVALMGMLGGFAMVGMAACGSAVDTPVLATSTAVPPTVMLATAATATNAPTVLPTKTAILATETPSEEPMAMGTPSVESMLMEGDTATAEPPASATQVAVAPEATATTAAKENADSSTISAVLREWALDLSANEVAAGKVTFSVTNQGSMGHNLTVVDSSGSVVGATPTFRKSEGAQSLEVTLAPGTYTVLCSLPGHAAMGQKAQLVVK